MPSFIGSSFIPGNFASGGLTGTTGPTGPVGNTGPTGITTGNTGATGSWITAVSSISALDQVTLVTSKNEVYSFRGFTGATGYWFASTGVCAATGSNLASPFFRVDGMTFEFFGICGGTNTTVTSDPDFITVTIKTQSGSYGLSGTTGYVPYVQGNTLQATSIYADSNNSLNFGLTGYLSGNPTIKALFADFNESLTIISSNNRTDPAGGHSVDLSQSSLYWLNTPIGITAFTNPNTTANVRQNYTFFINGWDVWNFPKNVIFSSSDSLGGFNKSRLLDGINIIQLWSDDGGITFIGQVISKGIGSGIGGNPSIVFNIGEWGSCCNGGSCTENVHKSNCTGTSVFRAFTPCSERTDCAPFAPPSTGACCCGITGCIDSSNAPAGILVDAAWCAGICGSFKLGQTCSLNDKGTAYQARSGVGANSIVDSICPNGCGEPVTCCNSGVATQETEWLCNQLGGIPIVGKTIQQVQNEGGCGFLTQLGACKQNGVCVDNVRRNECGCGIFYTSLAACAADTDGSPDTTVTLSVQNQSPEIRVLHSVNPETQTNTVTTYSNNVGDPFRSTKLRYEIVTPSGVTKRYKIGGTLQISDVNVSRNIDIWNTTNCIQFTLTAQDGSVMNSETILTAPTTFDLQIDVDTAACVTEFSGDTNFTGLLKVLPVSCLSGPVTSAEVETLVSYTQSPCRCLEIGSGSKGITGDIVNKLPTTIPFTATRYCTHCTTSELGGNADEPYIVHIPYPLKRQKGFISFCPPTDSTAGVTCSLPEYWCVRYERIDELSGCTQSSLFDINGDNRTAIGSQGKDMDDNDVTVPETNIAPSGCVHMEYNPVNILDDPIAGTTFWFTGQWDYADFDSADSISIRGNVRPCDPGCRIKIPTYACSTSIDQYQTSSSCDGDLVSHCCKTCPGKPLFVGDEGSRCDPTQGLDQFCLDYQPYFNVVKFDPDVLNEISNTYNFDVSELQFKLTNEVLNYGNLPTDPPGSSPRSGGNLFNPMKQQTQEIYNAGVDTIPGLDVDDKAKDSCSACPDRFDKRKTIQVPYVNDADFATQTFDVYGMVIAKETTCTETGGYVSGRTDDCENWNPSSGCIRKSLSRVDTYGRCPNKNTVWFEYKYYIIIIQNNNEKMNVFDIGSTSEMIKNTYYSQYEALCAGGSFLCNTDCGNGAQLKQVKWFGTLTSSASNLLNGFCLTSKQLRYNILKDLDGVVPNGTGIFDINSVIEFLPAGSADTVVFNSIQQPSKLNNLAQMMANIFGKEKSDDYISKLYTVCSTQDGSSSCLVNIVPQLMEFIGKDCYLEGFDPTGAFKPVQIVYDNSNNLNKIELKENGVPKNVWWLIEHKTESTTDANGGYPWIIESPSSTTTLHNFYAGKYAAFDNEIGSSLSDDEQTCGLSELMLDNRWLKNYNLSYLEINSDGFIAKRRMIYESPERGITLAGVVYLPAGGEGPVAQTNIGFDWNSEQTYLSAGCLTNIPDDTETIERNVPKLDLNRSRPITKIQWARVLKPDRTNGQHRYKFAIQLNDMRNSGWGLDNIGYMKFLYKKPGTNNILDVTPVVRYSMSLDGVFDPFVRLEENANGARTQWNNINHDEYWITLDRLNDVTNSSNGNFSPIMDGSSYKYHADISDNGTFFAGLHTEENNPPSRSGNFGAGLTTRLKQFLADNPEFCDDPGNCSNWAINNNIALGTVPTTPTGLASLFEDGKIYVLLKEEAAVGNDSLEDTNGAYQNIFAANYGSWERLGLLPSSSPDDDNVPFNLAFGDRTTIDSGSPFNTYPANISLCDFALSRIIPITEQLEAVRLTESLRSSINNNIKNIRINGNCTAIDCSEITDICNELESC